MCTSVQEAFHTVTPRLWKHVKRLHNPLKADTPLLSDDRLLVTDEEKAAVFQDTLQSVHSHPDSPDFDAIAERSILHYSILLLYTTDHDHPLEQPIGPDDIKDRLSKYRNTAPGPDGMANRILKALSDTAIEALAHLYTCLLYTSRCV